MLKNTKNKLLILGLLLTISAAALSIVKISGLAQQNPQTITILRRGDNTNSQSRPNNQKGKPATDQTQPTGKEIDDAAAPIFDLATANRNVDEKRLQKNRIYNNSSFDVIDEAKPGSDDVNIVSESVIPELPVEMSDLVIEGTVIGSNAFLSEDKTGVYSEFQIRIQKVIKPTDQLSAKQENITAERFGGRIRYPNGQVARYKIVGQGAPAKNAQYIFFLKKAIDGGYRILTAYETRGDKVYALDGSRNNPNGRGKTYFDKYNGKDKESFKNELENTLQQSKEEN